ncbi:hypothetical protein [Kineococcus auxinigenes]|uniref:hypothetical protein n=1 Tax=unclassified Kineococcus TaxID=2621656 RepID=UPI003D7D7F62
MDPVTAPERLGGAARSVALLGRTTRRALTAAVRSGEVLQPARRLYVLPSAEPDAVARAAVDEVLSRAPAA